MSKIYNYLEKQNKKLKNKILPCSYCGNKDIKICIDRAIFKTEKTDYTFYCACSTKNCDCSANASTPLKAVKLWNEQQTRLKNQK